MGADTKIQWCDHTFNPWIGCTRVSPGCQHCYAEAQNVRWRGGSNWGPGAPRQVTSAANWQQPLKWNREAVAAGERRRVFCASLADIFDAEAPEGGRDWLFEMIRATPALDWLLLTKRPERIRECLPADWGGGYPNVWLGTTVEDQRRAEERIPALLSVPARVRFLSCEPLLEEVDLRGTLPMGIDWVIIGGESGHGARPFKLNWARDLIEQCQLSENDAAPFVKQLGCRPMSAGRCDIAACNCGTDWETLRITSHDQPFPLALDRAHGGDPAEWPADLRVREFPKETR